jgi:hypothetical protein
VAEGGGLLNRYTLQRRIEGSNPSVSANMLSSDGLRASIREFECESRGTAVADSLGREKRTRLG